MIEFFKSFSVQGSSGVYNVKFTSNRFGVKANCDCMAGVHHQLCKHVTQFIETDEEIISAFREWGLMEVYEDYKQKKSGADKLNSEIKAMTKKFGQLYMYENQIDKLKEFEILKTESHNLKKKLERLLLVD